MLVGLEIWKCCYIGSWYKMHLNLGSKVLVTIEPECCYNTKIQLILESSFEVSVFIIWIRSDDAKISEEFEVLIPCTNAFLSIILCWEMLFGHFCAMCWIMTHFSCFGRPASHYSRMAIHRRLWMVCSWLYTRWFSYKNIILFYYFIFFFIKHH